MKTSLDFIKLGYLISACVFLSIDVLQTTDAEWWKLALFNAIMAVYFNIENK